MTAPRVEIDLDKLEHNARMLVARLGRRGIAVTGVTKAALGSADVASAFLRGGVRSLGDARIENLAALRRARVPASMMLIRSPMLSQVERVVAHADVSCNTELAVLRGLSAAARATGRTHGVVLMVELGDLREGLLPDDLEDAARATLGLPNLALTGIGANLACRSGVVPGPENMEELSALADALEATFGVALELVSGGNSANLTWALGDPAGASRINHLRLGEALLLGRETLARRPIDGLHTDAFTLVAEVIEAKVKPSLPWGARAQNAFGEPVTPRDRGEVAQVILALGRQDTDPDGLSAPKGIELLSASSDHLIADAGRTHLPVGAEVRLQPDYSALVRAMTSPFVTQVLHRRGDRAPAATAR